MLPPFVYLIIFVVFAIVIGLGGYFGNKKYKEYKKNKASAPAPVSVKGENSSTSES